MRTLLPNKAYVVKWQFFGNDDCLQVFVLPAKVEPLIVVSPLRGRTYLYTMYMFNLKFIPFWEHNYFLTDVVYGYPLGR